MIEDVFDCKTRKAIKRAMDPEREAAFHLQQAKDIADKNKQLAPAESRLAALEEKVRRLEGGG